MGLWKIRGFFRKKKIGLTLGSGGARGLSHIGVIKAIQERDIPIDLITGTSIGSLVGACFAKNGSIKEFESLMLNIDWKKLASLVDTNFVLFNKGFVQGEKVKELLFALIGDVQFSDLKIPMAIVAADVETGEQVVLREGSVIDAVRASISMPAVFVAAKVKDRFLMDGGVVNPVPADIAKEMGATFIIACDVSGAAQNRASIAKKVKDKKQNKTIFEEQRSPIMSIVVQRVNDRLDLFMKEDKEWLNKFQGITKWGEELKPGLLKSPSLNAPSLFYTLTQALYSMEYKIVQSQLKDADVIIRPDTGGVNTLDFHRARELIVTGYEAAKEKLEGIRL